MQDWRTLICKLCVSTQPRTVAVSTPETIRQTSSLRKSRRTNTNGICLRRTRQRRAEPARTNLVIAACDSDFSLMGSWFRNISLDVNLPVFHHGRRVRVLKPGARTPPRKAGLSFPVRAK